MRLVAAPDGLVDSKDRALWLTMPFDVKWWSPAQPAIYRRPSDEQVEHVFRRRATM